MQKLVTIYLDNTFDHNQVSGKVDEHLEHYLADGWTVKVLSAMSGGAADNMTSCGWVTVLLEN